ncbi:MAG: class I SAM-dependent methyltransferase [Deltaproteobacteria bacterium]|jgi:SAM-dependent methyltransferase|nr:class I SAM-dependent methyltransferase [Deltaproteobacteria bacterium]
MLTESQRDPKCFWDKKARVFPKFSPGEDTYEAQVLGKVMSCGVHFEGASVLDVGSGSGMYTLRIAKMAKCVTAVDISSEMLKILKNDAAGLGISNITYVNMDFLDFTPEKSYDIVWCSMSPAVGSEAGQEKLLSLPSATVVFTSAFEPMRSDILEGLFKYYNIQSTFLNGVGRMKNTLQEKLIPFKTIPLVGQWNVLFSFEDIKYSILGTLENFNVEVDHKHLDGYLKQFENENGQYLEKTNYKLEIIIWQNY